MGNLRVALAAIVAMGMTACSGGGAGATGEPQAPASAQITVYNPAGASFANNFIKIHGVRDGLADLKYPCSSEFTLCLPINADGSVEEITDLCPTINTNDPGSPGSGTWSFDYAIYTNSGCADPAMANLVCPNTTQQTLGTGTTVNNIQCTTDNGSAGVNVCIYDPQTGAQSGKGCPPGPASQYFCTSDAQCASVVPGTHCSYSGVNTAVIFANDSAGWVNAVGGVYTLEDFEDTNLKPELSFVAQSSYANISGGVFHDQLQEGVSTTKWSFSAPVYAFGANWNPGEPGGPGTGIAVNYGTGEFVRVGEVPNGYVNQFWGFVSNVPFKEVLLEAGTNTYGYRETYDMDDLVYAVSGTARGTCVP